MNKLLLDKKFIKGLKKNPKTLLSFIKNEGNGTVVRLLNRFGKLDKNFNKDSLIFLLNDSSENVRMLAIKNLAKLKDITLLPIFSEIGKKDPSTVVRREAVSAIGRLRKPKIIKILIKFLKDSDPKIAMQAIRGLVAFKEMPVVRGKFKKLLNHPNELIKNIINIEINGSNNKNKTKLNHKEFPEFLKNVVIHADVLEVLKYVPKESIHLTFTSPPYYNARDYSIYKSYDEYLTFLKKVFKEVYKVTKEGRFFILNTSPIIIPRMGRKYSSKRYPIPYDIHPFLTKMGWEFIDDIIWVKHEASVKNRNAGFLQHRKPLAYKPNAVTEMLMVYRKKTNRLIDWNIKQYDSKTVKKSKVSDGYETKNVWYIDPTFDKVHAAVFPEELCDRVISFYSYIGDLIFDPFAGSGTLGRSAAKLNRHFFLTEKNKKYINRMKEKIKKNHNFLPSMSRKPKFLNIKQFIKRSKER